MWKYPHTHRPSRAQVGHERRPLTPCAGRQRSLPRRPAASDVVKSFTLSFRPRHLPFLLSCASSHSFHSLSLSSSSTSRNQEQSIRPFHRSAPPDHLPQIDRNRSSFITVASSPTRPCQAPALHRRESRWNRVAGPFFRPSSTSTSNSLVRSSFSSLDGSNRL